MDQDSKTTEKTTEPARPKAGEQHELAVPLDANRVPARRETGLPAVIRRRRGAWRFRALIAIAMLVAGGGAAYYWWQRLHPAIAAGHRLWQWPA